MGVSAGTTQESSEVSRLTAHLFREESGKLVSVLTGLFGIERLQLAEDVVQEALVRALQTWPFYGIPQNPAAWLTQTAKNLALDVVRREKNFHEKQAQLTTFLEVWSGDFDAAPEPAFETEVKDDRLRLMFACCHPELPSEAQAALALKTLCGFGTVEISKAFLTTEAAIAKRLVRARQRIRELGIPFEIPAGEELSPRLAGVLQTLYLLFSEGYKASSGDSLIREELCHEAIRLAALLAEHPLTGQPRTHALLALMLLNAARLSARLDGQGNILRLQEQDRTRWSRELIVRGLRHLALSAEGDEMSEYHLQAGIAACHCTAEDYPSTDWARIVALYDQMLRLDPSPIIALNRAVALANLRGPAEGLAAIEAIQNRQPLDSYYLFHAVRAEFEAQLQCYDAALAHLRKALPLTELKSEHALLSGRLREYERLAKAG